jgi:hypothetical protein
VNHRLGIEVLAPAGEREQLVLAEPVEGRGHPLALEPVPPLRQPQLVPLVSSVGDERSILGGGDEAIGEREGREKSPVSRLFVVEAEGLNAVTGLDQSTLEVDERERQRASRLARHAPIHGRGWALREDVLDVGEHQLLMLLLVVSPYLDDTEELIVDARFHRSRHPRVDVVTVSPHFIHRRARQQTTARSRILLTDGVVVRVEQVRIRVVEGWLAEPAQNERLEEPGGVRQVPFRRADVGHGLNDVIFGG